MDKAEIDVLAERVLRDVFKRRATEQLFLFGPSSNPFWRARQQQAGQARRAVNPGEGAGAVESTKPKPLVDHDNAGRFSVAALGDDSDL
jgi:hypothetical protein